MAIYALSDLHIHCEDQPYLFTPEKEALFCKLITEILNNGSELLIAGDFIDLTGMRCPEFGHLDFFKELFSDITLTHPAIQKALIRLDLPAMLRGVRERFPKLFDGLSKLAQARRLIIIPGNHDCDFTQPLGQEIMATELGVSSDQIRWEHSFRAGNVVFAAHGNQFDPSNQTDAGCYNRGAAITSALYCALMPALEVFGVPERVVAAIPAVRPEEVVIRGIELYLGRRESNRLVQAFVALITKNGYFSGFKRGLLLPLTHSIPLLTPIYRRYITPRQLSRAMPDESMMRHHVRDEAELLQKRLTPESSVVVVGHTHEMDVADHYLNLGTWIDHMTGISLQHLEAAETALPVLRISETGNLDLYDARDLGQSSQLEECRRICGIRVEPLGINQGSRNKFSLSNSA